MRAVVVVEENIMIMMKIIAGERDLGPEKTDMMITREVEEETIQTILRMRTITAAIRSCLIFPDINLSSTGFSSEKRISLYKAARNTRSSGNTSPSIKLWPGKN